LVCFQSKQAAKASDVNLNFKTLKGWLTQKVGAPGTGVLSADSAELAKASVGDMNVTKSLSSVTSITAPNVADIVFQDMAVDMTGARSIPVDGEKYRRFQLEVEGTLTGPASTVTRLSVQPNGDTDSSHYGPGVHHFLEHAPGVLFTHSADGIMGMPLCSNNKMKSGYVQCTGTLNSQKGRYRMLRAESSWVDPTTDCGTNGAGATTQTGCIGLVSIHNAWRNDTDPLTSLQLYLVNATSFKGAITIYGIK
jgi:hypothetical protein